jgi:hypothetical protein
MKQRDEDLAKEIELLRHKIESWNNLPKGEDSLVSSTSGMLKPLKMENQKVHEYAKTKYRVEYSLVFNP